MFACILITSPVTTHKRSIYSTASSVPRHRLTSGDRRLPWEVRFQIYVMPVCKDDCLIDGLWVYFNIKARRWRGERIVYGIIYISYIITPNIIIHSLVFLINHSFISWTGSPSSLVWRAILSIYVCCCPCSGYSPSGVYHLSDFDTFRQTFNFTAPVKTIR